MKCCSKLETAKERCPIVFQGHPSNFKVTWDKTSPILTQIGRFRTIGRSQLSNPSDLPCLIIYYFQFKFISTFFNLMRAWNCTGGNANSGGRYSIHVCDVYGTAAPSPAMTSKRKWALECIVFNGTWRRWVTTWTIYKGKTCLYRPMY